MRTVEAKGADIEEAIENGLSELDVARENVIVEILEEPNRGLLGIGSKEAVVRLTTFVPPRSERDKFFSSQSAEEDQKADERDNESRQESSDRGSDNNRYNRRGNNNRRGNYRGGKRGGKRGGNNNRRGGNRKDRREENRRLRAELESIDPIRETEVVTDESQIPEGVKVGLETLLELLAQMHVIADIAVERISEEGKFGATSPWLLHIHGDNVQQLIGRDGQTLSALEYLTRLIASRDIEERAEFSVDVDDYRARREVQLERIANRKADEAIKKSKTIYLRPMSASERRIVHMVLREHQQVVTESKGEGKRRRVTIIPK